jgi:16S rRNA processing protein RimM
MLGRNVMTRITLAAVAGAHGIKGELRLKLFGAGAASLARYDEVWLGGERRQLLWVKDSGKTTIARIAGVDERSGAEALRGTLIEIDRAELPPLGEGEYYHADLIGLTCFAKDGETVGSVAAVENYGAGDLLEIERVDGTRSLIPFKDGIADLVDARIVLDPEFLA